MAKVDIMKSNNTVIILFTNKKTCNYIWKYLKMKYKFDKSSKW